MLAFVLSPIGRILLLLGIVGGILLAVAVHSYGKGVEAGRAEIQEKWDADKQAAREAQDELVAKLAKAEGVHAADQQLAARELAKARDDAAGALLAQRTVYEQRLLQSARRSEVYRDQAASGATAARDLARHAAELDRALEEGRELVGELRETLGLRDHQVRILGEQILSDRKLMEGEATR